MAGPRDRSARGFRAGDGVQRQFRTRANPVRKRPLLPEALGDPRWRQRCRPDHRQPAGLPCLGKTGQIAVGRRLRRAGGGIGAQAVRRRQRAGGLPLDPIPGGLVSAVGVDAVGAGRLSGGRPEPGPDPCGRSAFLPEIDGHGGRRAHVDRNAALDKI